MTSVWVLVQAAREAKVPYIVGFNSLEFPGAMVAKSASISALLPVLTGDEHNRALASYGDEARLSRELASDYLFVEPALALAKAHAATGAPTYVYRFDGAPSSVRSSVGGAFHASERAFVFGNPAAAPWKSTASAVALADKMNFTWSKFAQGELSKLGWPEFKAGGVLWQWTEAGEQTVPVLTLAGAAFVGTLRDQR